MSCRQAYNLLRSGTLYKEANRIMTTYDGHMVKVSSKSTDCKTTVSVFIFARADFTIVREHQYLKWISYNSYF